MSEKEKNWKERYKLAIPTQEHFDLYVEVELTKDKDGFRHIKVSAIANNEKTLSWYKWKRMD